MGFKDLLTKPINLTGAKLTWQEPFLFPVRLRGDILFRALLCVGAWLAASGVLLALFSLSEKPANWNIALGLGLIGGGYAWGCTFGLRSQVSGGVRLYHDRLQRGTTSFGFIWINLNDETWDMDAIERCTIYSPSSTGRGFALLLVSGGGAHSLLGIPQRVDLRQVAGVLQEQGVRVQQGATVPAQFTKPIAPAPPLGTLLAGGLLFVVGLAMYGSAGPVEPERLAGPLSLPGVNQDGGTTIHEGGRIPPLPRSASNGGAKAEATGAAAPISNPSSTPDVPGIPTPAFGGRSPFGPRGLPPGITDPGGPTGNGAAPSPGVPVIPPTGFRPTIPSGSPPAAGASPADGWTRSELVGGAGGFPFQSADRQLRPVIGVEYAMGSWAGKEHLRQLAPLFDRPANPRPNSILAEDGYALGAIHVTSGDFVDGVTLEFMKLDGQGGLNSSDSYRAKPIGKSGPEPRALTGQGKIIVGFHGRGGAVMDAIGLAIKR